MAKSLFQVLDPGFQCSNIASNWSVPDRIILCSTHFSRSVHQTHQWIDRREQAPQIGLTPSHLRFRSLHSSQANAIRRRFRLVSCAVVSPDCCGSGIAAAMSNQKHSEIKHSVVCVETMWTTVERFKISLLVSLRYRKDKDSREQSESH